MRLLYETDADKKAEREIALACAAVWGLECYKLPDCHCVDWVFHEIGDESIVHFLAEIKDRSGINGNRGLDFNFGNGYWLSHNKVLAIEEIRRESSMIPARLIVRFRDRRIRWTYANIYGDQFILGGRFDRPLDPSAIEIEVIFDWCCFQPLTTR